MQTLRYLFVVESTGTGYAGYFPDLDGCIATGGSFEEVVANGQVALEMHLAGMMEDGDPIPEPSQSVYLSAPLGIPQVA